MTNKDGHDEAKKAKLGRKTKTVTSVAVVLTFLVWLFFYVMYPDVPLSRTATSVLLVVMFGLVQIVFWIVESLVSKKRGVDFGGSPHCDCGLIV